MKLSIKYKDKGLKLFTFTNDNGVKLSVTNIGATITKLIVPDKNGAQKDLVLGYSKLKYYLENSPSHGTTVGRFANRIKNASFSLNGKTYQLDKNEGENTLHSGFDRYFTRIWESAVELGELPSVTFKLLSPDGDQGMPGAARIEVSYSLSRSNEVIIKYKAVSDQDTIFNLTNHSYFNLAGQNGESVLEHVLQLNCASFTPINAESIPSGEICLVRGTAFDFTLAKAIGRDIENQEEQLLFGQGYDHNYVLAKPSLKEPFAKVYSPESGIGMEAFTDMPGVQFYTGNFLGDGSHEKVKYPKRGGFCLETQFYPDSPNKETFPSCVFKAGQVFESTTIYKFSLQSKA